MMLELAIACAIGLVIGYAFGQYDTQIYIDKFYRDAWERSVKKHLDHVYRVLRKHGIDAK
jgi:membrane protein DedA with SNARE-associated domain